MRRMTIRVFPGPSGGAVQRHVLHAFGRRHRQQVATPALDLACCAAEVHEKYLEIRKKLLSFESVIYIHQEVFMLKYTSIYDYKQQCRND